MHTLTILISGGPFQKKLMYINLHKLQHIIGFPKSQEFWYTEINLLSLLIFPFKGFMYNFKITLEQLYMNFFIEEIWHICLFIHQMLSNSHFVKYLVFFPNILPDSLRNPSAMKKLLNTWRMLSTTLGSRETIKLSFALCHTVLGSKSVYAVLAEESCLADAREKVFRSIGPKSRQN